MDINSILEFKDELLALGDQFDRDFGTTKEILFKQMSFLPEQLSDFRRKELKHYKDIAMLQKQYLRDEERRNHWSRRLIMQFPREDCIESVCMTFISKMEYVVNVNMRSSNIDRLLEDMSIVRHICSEFLFPDYLIILVNVNCNNLHVYI